MEIQDILLNGVSITGLISAIAFFIILCVKPLREKFTEYIILKHEAIEQEEQLEKALKKIDELQQKVNTLLKENVQLKIEIAELKALLSKKE